MATPQNCKGYSNMIEAHVKLVRSLKIPEVLSHADSRSEFIPLAGSYSSALVSILE
jgi:hypothetical protein